MSRGRSLELVKRLVASSLHAIAVRGFQPAELMKPFFQPGHTLRLLEGGSELFASMAQAIHQARTSVWVETYILAFDNDALHVLHALEQAAARGVHVRLLIDGVGTPLIDPHWGHRLSAVGVQWRHYRPLGRFGLLIPSQWRRLHRKLCVVDGWVGFCGGINLIDDRDDVALGRLALPRLDFALKVQGPLVQDMRVTMDWLWRRLTLSRDLRQRDLAQAWQHWRSQLPRVAPVPLNRSEPSNAQAALLLRDNVLHRHDIERAYLKAIGAARRHIVVANAYLIPGRRVRRALGVAVQRGVLVELLIQGKYEGFWQFHAARPVHAALLRAGVHIYEYGPSALHAKVAVIDGQWATVGSTNLDPLSLLLAREANVVTTDAALAQQLERRLQRLIACDGVALDADALKARPLWARIQDRVAFAVMRTLLFVTGHRY